MLPPIDQAYLDERAPESTVTNDSGAICVIIPNFPLPAGFTRDIADLMLRLSPGYPDVPPDMWWFAPSVGRVDGRVIQATEVEELHFGRVWQRWSRHLDPGQWRSGIDSVESYLALVRAELRTASLAIAA